MYKIVHDSDYKEAVQNEYNVAPEGWREVDEKYIAQRFSTYTPIRMEHRQIIRYADGTEVGKFLGVWMFHQHDGTGWAMEANYWGRGHYDTPKGDEKHLIFYAFGCEHSYVDYEVPSGHRSGIHKAKCSKCGNLTSYDTSD